MATAKASPKKKPAPKAADKKVATSKTATKKTSSTKKAEPKKAAPKKAQAISGFERYKMIEVAAYYMAEKNGFGGHAVDYWVAAEKVIDKKLAVK